MADKTPCVVCGELAQVEVTSATADSQWYCLNDCPAGDGILSLEETPATYATMAPDIQEATPVEETSSTNKKSTKGVS
jgi:phage/plasmid primase-like uncharacterized protein